MSWRTIWRRQELLVFKKTNLKNRFVFQNVRTSHVDIASCADWYFLAATEALQGLPVEIV